jgi:hypothetical protein
MSIKKQAENGRKAGGNQAVLNSIGTNRDSVETVGIRAESELRGGFFSQVHVELGSSMQASRFISPKASTAPLVHLTVPSSVQHLGGDSD